MRPGPLSSSRPDAPHTATRTHPADGADLADLAGTRLQSLLAATSLALRLEALEAARRRNERQRTRVTPRRDERCRTRRDAQDPGIGRGERKAKRHWVEHALVRARAHRLGHVRPLAHGSATTTRRMEFRAGGGEARSGKDRGKGGKGGRRRCLPHANTLGRSSTGARSCSQNAKAAETPKPRVREGTGRPTTSDNSTRWCRRARKRGGTRQGGYVRP